MSTMSTSSRIAPTAALASTATVTLILKFFEMSWFKISGSKDCWQFNLDFISKLCWTI